MKKINVFILLLIMFLPVVVNAKEGCSIVSGNGKDIGSEIACGSEHFYVVENKNDQIKMLSKYNLYVGANYNKIKVDPGIYSLKECQDESCTSFYWSNDLYYFDNEQVESEDQWINLIKNKYNLGDIFSSNYIDGNNVAMIIYNRGAKTVVGDKNYIKYDIKLYPYTTITQNISGFALQNELARGVTGEKGNANYPIYATLSLHTDYYDRPENTIEILDNFENGYTNFQFTNNSNVKNYLNYYKNNLNNMGYEVSEVDIFTIKNIYDLVYSINKKKLPLSDWFDQSLGNDPMIEDGLDYYTLGDLKEYLSNDYSWLWSTTYWTRTYANNISNYDTTSIPESSRPDMPYFVSSSGEICYSETECYGSVPRAGLRPVVTIVKSNIKYKIFTKTDGNGTIEVVDSAFGGDSISFRVSAKKGLKLAGLTVTTDSNEKVEFSEGDITQDKSGVYSISTNKFTMPFENVTIQARWGLINPETGMIYSIIILVLLILGISTSLIIKKKKI